MPTRATQFNVDGLAVSNPRGRLIQAVLFVNWPFAPPRTLGGVPCLPKFGGWRIETVDASADLLRVVKAAKQQGALSIEVHPV